MSHAALFMVLLSFPGVKSMAPVLQLDFDIENAYQMKTTRIYIYPNCTGYRTYLS